MICFSLRPSDIDTLHAWGCALYCLCGPVASLCLVFVRHQYRRTRRLGANVEGFGQRLTSLSATGAGSGAAGGEPTPEKADWSTAHAVHAPQMPEPWRRLLDLGAGIAKGYESQQIYETAPPCRVQAWIGHVPWPEVHLATTCAQPWPPAQSAGPSGHPKLLHQQGPAKWQPTSPGGYSEFAHFCLATAGLSVGRGGGGPRRAARPPAKPARWLLEITESAQARCHAHLRPDRVLLARATGVRHSSALPKVGQLAPGSPGPWLYVTPPNAAGFGRQNPADASGDPPGAEGARAFRLAKAGAGRGSAGAGPSRKAGQGGAPGAEPSRNLSLSESGKGLASARAKPLRGPALFQRWSPPQEARTALVNGSKAKCPWSTPQEAK